MKQNNKVLNTILILFLGIILSLMFKYFHFLKQPDYIRDNYQSFLSYPGVGGILSILTLTSAMFIIINIWKKTKEEKLLKNGKIKEVEKIKNLFNEGILTEKEVNEKFDILLNELENEKKERDNIIEINKTNELINKLSELKEKGLLSEKEFELKKNQVISERQIKSE